MGFALGATLSMVLAVPGVGFAGQAFADATPNNNNCLGAGISEGVPPGVGPVVSDLAQTSPGAVAGAVHLIRDVFCN